MTAQGQALAQPGALPAQLGRRFEAVLLSWGGRLAAGAAGDLGGLGRAIAEACELGLEIAIVAPSSTADELAARLGARPRGPGRLHLGVEGGAAVARVDADGVHECHRAAHTHQEQQALEAAARAAAARLAERGVRAEVVAPAPDRRRLDLAADGDADIAGIADLVSVAREAAQEAGLADPRVTHDGRSLDLALAGPGDAARWLFAELWRGGIPPALVLVAAHELGGPDADAALLVAEAATATAVSVGAEAHGLPPGAIHLGGGAATYAALIADQVERRRRGEVPDVRVDTSWTVSVAGLDSQLERVHETLLTVGDGRLGTKGSPTGFHSAASPSVLAAGIYDGHGSEIHLLECPTWTQLAGSLPHDPLFRRRLDLHSGLLHEELALPEGSVGTMRFSSLARPGTVVMRAQGPAPFLGPAPALASSHPSAESGASGDRQWVRVQGTAGGVAAAARDVTSDLGRRVERLGAYAVAPGPAPGHEQALALLGEAEEAGFERLLSEHRAAWARRWETADIVIDGDPDVQLAIRFSLFQLMGAVASAGEAGLGARGQSGPGYRGHVFWDSDVFVLPFLAATHPPAARAMIEYRLRRLPDALKAAAAIGRRGARFPWESAHDGFDCTPHSIRDLSGQVVRIRTGELEDHIVADVAWAANFYLEWTGDEDLVDGPGLALFVETARYWASRVRFDRRGRAHIYGVIGPDEYHEPVDDNAYTNVMARWNLRRAAELAGGAVPLAERTEWLRTADALIDGYDAETGLYEQCAGFYGLEPLLIAEFAPRRPIAADFLLGFKRVRGAQVVKQADVLMMYHLIPHEVAADSLNTNLDFYEPRTAHGSSLSPAIHAGLHARVGRFDEALASLRIAARIDMDDLTGTTGGGLHIATMGGFWQALVFGFAGIRAKDGIVRIDPRLPPQWNALELALQYRGTPLRVRIEADSVSVDADGPLDWEVVRT